MAFSATTGQTLFVYFTPVWRDTMTKTAVFNLDSVFSGIYAAILFSHAIVGSTATRVIARLQWLYVAMNIL
jgi:hypothetical protein